MRYAIVDVYRLDTTEYDGRITELLKEFEEGVKKHGKQEFHRWLESFSKAYEWPGFSKYDYRNRQFNAIRPDAGGKGREDAGNASQGDNGRGVAEGGAKSPWGLKSDFPERLRYLWPSYKEMVRDHKYRPKKLKPTGILKINEAYDEHPVKPVIETTNNAFKITLPNSNYQAESQKSPNTAKTRHGSTADKKGKRLAAILKLCRDQGSFARADVEKALDISQSTAILLLREMVDNGTLIKKGKGKNLRYHENK